MLTCPTAQKVGTADNDELSGETQLQRRGVVHFF